ncbi:MAG: heparinase II/III family protein [Verrucomicrobia bacterium]|nr:heparinase II/III family protein [Verrucomicrobiota bacterium]
MTRNLNLSILTAAAAIALSSQAAPELPTQLPPHPRLLFSQPDIPLIKHRIATQPWAKSRFAALKDQADGWIGREVKLPAKGSQWFHYYSCPKHGARLRTEGPTRHVCPIDGEVLSGYPYDDVVLASEHNRLAGAIRTLGIVHQLTGEPRYAAKAREILLAYAARYRDYPLHNIRGEPNVGGGKVGPQTLDESTWLIPVVEGADCIWDMLSAEEQAKVKEGLLLPATDVIRQHKMGIHNIQSWKNSAMGLTGLLISDMNLVDEALNGASGYFNQMMKGTTPDGAWYEGAWGYHFYTVSAVVRLTEGALHSGIDLYRPEFKRMFDAPLDLAMPDLRLPAFNDSHEVSIPNSAGLYEIAFARYKNPRYQVVLGRSQRDNDAALLHGVAEVGRPPDLAPASRNFPASGFSILTSASGRNATWLCLDYGPHGGGHGHPDKLGFVLYGLGQVLAPDPGTANYGVPIQAGWYRTTIAHNTLTVDEGSQKAAEGKCEAFLAAKGFCAVMAGAGPIYDGVAFRRSVALLGDKRLVFIDQVRAEKERTFDLAYHNAGICDPPPGAAAFEPPKKAGYSYLRDAKMVTSGNGLGLTFKTSRGGREHWTMAGGEATSFIVGTGVGAHTEDRVPLVIARRKAKETVYVWALSLSDSAESFELSPMAARLSDGSAAQPNEAVAVGLKVGSNLDVFVVNPRQEKIVVADQPINAKLAWLSGDSEMKLLVQAVANN